MQFSKKVRKFLKNILKYAKKQNVLTTYLVIKELLLPEYRITCLLKKKTSFYFFITIHINNVEYL